jgi:tRNA1(Val) A37 N6-methylase TrmN6
VPEVADGSGEGTGLDRLLGGRLVLRQPARGHRAGTDAILLAASVPAVSGARAIDFGAGVGTAGLALTRRTGARVLLVERDPELAALATENVDRNGLTGRIAVHCGAVEDLDAAAAGDFASADHALANPPFNPPGGRPPPDPRTAAARVARPGLFEDWARAAARLVRPGGSFTLICRPESLGEVLAALDGRFGALSLCFVHPEAVAPAVRLLACGVKGSRGPLRIAPPLVLNRPDGGFTELAEAIHRHAAALPPTR